MVTDTPYPQSEGAALRRDLERVTRDVEAVQAQVQQGRELMVRLDERVETITGEVRGVRKALYALLAAIVLAAASGLINVILVIATT